MSDFQRATERPDLKPPHGDKFCRQIAAASGYLWSWMGRNLFPIKIQHVKDGESTDESPVSGSDLSGAVVLLFLREECCSPHSLFCNPFRNAPLKALIPLWISIFPDLFGPLLQHPPSPLALCLFWKLLMIFFNGLDSAKTVSQHFRGFQEQKKMRLYNIWKLPAGVRLTNNLSNPSCIFIKEKFLCWAWCGSTCFYGKVWNCCQMNRRDDFFLVPEIVIA